MKKFLKKITNKDFLISIFCLMGLQAIIYALIKYLQFDYHSGLSTIDNIIPFVLQKIKSLFWGKKILSSSFWTTPDRKR